MAFADRKWRLVYWGTVVVMLVAFVAFHYGTRNNERTSDAAPALAPASAVMTDTAGPAASDIPLPPLDGELY